MSETAANGGGAATAVRQDVFISYSHHNQAVADAIASLLERDGLRCWYASRDISAGEEWAEAIMNAINLTSVLVLVFSVPSNASHQVRRELDLATSREVPIIPFMIQEAEPHPALRYYIATAHWMDALTPPLEARIRALSEAVRRLLAKPLPKFSASDEAAARFVAGVAAETGRQDDTGSRPPPGELADLSEAVAEHVAGSPELTDESTRLQRGPGPVEAPPSDTTAQGSEQTRPLVAERPEPSQARAEAPPEVTALERRAQTLFGAAIALSLIPILVIAWFHNSTDAGFLMFAALGGPIAAAVGLMLYRMRLVRRLEALRETAPPG